MIVVCLFVAHTLFVVFSHVLFFYYSVLVHSGGVHGGHYYAFIRPTLSDQWYVLFSNKLQKYFVYFLILEHVLYSWKLHLTHS